MSVKENAHQKADDLTDMVLSGVKRNLILNAVARIALALLAVGTMAATCVYVYMHADEIVTAIGDPAADAEPVATLLLAHGLPVGLLTLLAILAGIATWTLHSRGQDELEQAMDGIGRIRREAEVAIPARGLAHVFEEKLAHARKAYLLQLWLGRTLFLVSIGLFVAAVISMFATNSDLVTVGFTAGSVVGAVWGAVNRVPGRIGHHLADVVQLQTAITGCDRQIGLLETYAYALLANRDNRDFQKDLTLLQQVHTEIEDVLDRAINRVELYADPGDDRKEGEQDWRSDTIRSQMNGLRTGSRAASS